MRQGPCPTLEGARGFWIKKKRLLASLKTIFLPSVFWEWVLGRTLGVELKCDTLLCGKGGPPPPSVCDPRVLPAAGLLLVT